MKMNLLYETQFSRIEFLNWEYDIWNYLILLSSVMDMKNKLFDKDRKVIWPIASSTMMHKPDSLRYCVRRNAQ